LQNQLLSWRTENSGKRFKNPRGARIYEAVENRLCVSPRRDEAIFPQARKVLRQSRLR
jgi:hypothetical protein